MQVIAGSMNLGRIEEIASSDIVISREDWYDIYRAAEMFCRKKILILVKIQRVLLIDFGI